MESFRGVPPSAPTSHAPRTTRRGGTFAPFIPAGIGERSFTPAGAARDALEQATGALADLRRLELRLASPRALAQALLRAEVVASSRIEGVRVSQARLARYQSARAADPRALEVHANLRALRQALELGARSPAFGVAELEGLHRTLFEATDDRDIAGVLRAREEDWLGADDYHPVGADFVPPPPEQVRSSLEDLCVFIQRTDMPPLVQAGVAHAQFKNIHPFAVGNGRTGRALIHTVLRRRGETVEFIVPLSVVLASRPKRYAAGVGAYSVGEIDVWCAEFARMTTRAARQAAWFAEAMDARSADWLDRLGNPRRSSAARQLLGELAAHPVLDLRLAERLTGKSHTAVHAALNGMEVAGVIEPLGDRRRGRAWVANELLELLEQFGRRASAERA